MTYRTTYPTSVVVTDEEYAELVAEARAPKRVLEVSGATDDGFIVRSSWAIKHVLDRRDHA